MIEIGAIQKSKLEWSSAAVIKKEKYGDFCKLNNITVKNEYPMPNIHNITTNLANATIFSCFDISRVYYNIPLDEEDLKKTATLLLSYH